MKPCIPENWYASESIERLADAANEWRNELAHEKREYVPSRETINAIRFVEHLNYAIVLRKLGFTDDEIRYILEYTLIR